VEVEPLFDVDAVILWAAFVRSRSKMFGGFEELIRREKLKKIKKKRKIPFGALNRPLLRNALPDPSRGGT